MKESILSIFSFFLFDSAKLWKWKMGKLIIARNLFFPFSFCQTTRELLLLIPTAISHHLSPPHSTKASDFLAAVANVDNNCLSLLSPHLLNRPPFRIVCHIIIILRMVYFSFLPHAHLRTDWRKRWQKSTKSHQKSEHSIHRDMEKWKADKGKIPKLASL